MVKIEADEDKLKRIVEYPKPHTKEEVNYVIGLIRTLNYWSGKMSQILEELHKLAAPKTHFKGAWGEEHNREFEAVKANLKGHLELHVFDPQLWNNLYSDAEKT